MVEYRQLGQLSFHLGSPRSPLGGLVVAREGPACCSAVGSECLKVRFSELKPRTSFLMNAFCRVPLHKSRWSYGPQRVRASPLPQKVEVNAKSPSQNNPVMKEQLQLTVMPIKEQLQGNRVHPGRFHIRFYTIHNIFKKGNIQFFWPSCFHESKSLFGKDCMTQAKSGVFIRE